MKTGHSKMMIAVCGNWRTRFFSQEKGLDVRYERDRRNRQYRVIDNIGVVEMFCDLRVHLVDRQKRSSGIRSPLGRVTR